RGPGDQVTRDLLGREAIEGEIPVERVDEPIAVAPDRAVKVPLVPTGVGVASEVEPHRRPALPIPRRGEQALDDLLVCLVGWSSAKFRGLLRRGRKSDEVQADPA